jgi:hypothetical protein
MPDALLRAVALASALNKRTEASAAAQPAAKAAPCRGRTVSANALEDVWSRRRFVLHSCSGALCCIHVQALQSIMGLAWCLVEEFSTGCCLAAVARSYVHVHLMCHITDMAA